MSRRRTHRADQNQPDLVKQARKVPGMKVAITSQVGDGFPDLVIGRRVSIDWLKEKFGDWVPMNFIVEIKPTASEKLRKKQADFEADWPGQYDRATTLSEILKLTGAMP